MLANHATGKTSRHEADELTPPDLPVSDMTEAMSPIAPDAIGSDSDLQSLERRFSPRYNLFITISGIVLAEIIAMIVVYGFRDLPYYQQVFIDASIMTLIIFPILYFLSFRPLLQHIQRVYQAERDIRIREQREFALTQTIHTMQWDIARDLHDTIGQNISFLRMKLDDLAGRKNRKQAEIQAEIKSMARAANETYDLIRGTLAILQSVDSTDLYRLFTRYAEQIEERSTFKVKCSSQGGPKPLSAPIMRQVFYIFREIMNNVEKHAHARQVTLDVQWNADDLKLVIADDGRGFELNKIPFGGHYGLKFMGQRVELLSGTMLIHTAPGSGTTVEIRIPYE